MNKLAVFLLSVVIFGCVGSTEKKLSEKEIIIEWIPFKWIGAKLGGKYYDKLGMEVPVIINDSINHFAQFDLGANTNMLYESTLKKYTDIPNVFTIDTIETESYYYWLRQPNIKIGKIPTNVNDWIVRNDYDAEGVIGTVGAEEFKNKILIIDYPNKRLANLDSVPQEYQEGFNFFDFKLKNNKVILNILINGKKYNVNFDTGSSITPLLISDSTLFNELTDRTLGSDTLRGFSSWGKTYDIIPGAISKNNFVIGQKDLKRQVIYYLDSDYHRKLFRQDNIVGLLGSVIFFNNEILIDFKNQKMGIRITNKNTP